MITILITGGSGFIGSHLVEYFQGRAQGRVLDNFRSGHRRNLEGFEVELIEGDILDRAVFYHDEGRVPTQGLRMNDDANRSQAVPACWEQGRDGLATIRLALHA